MRSVHRVPVVVGILVVHVFWGCGPAAVLGDFEEDGWRQPSANDPRGALILNLDANFRMKDMIKVFGKPEPTWKHALGFTVQINPLQDGDARIKSVLSEAFSLAKQHDLRLLVHVNNEWLFRGCAYCSNSEYAYANQMVEQITGVKVLAGGYQRVNSAPAVLERVEWTSWTKPQDVNLLYWGNPPTPMPPRINFASAWIRQHLEARAQVVNQALQSCFATYFPQTDPRFVGIDIGWETAIEDQDAAVKLGFGALKTLGYSASSNLSSGAIDDILLQAAKAFADHSASLYTSVVSKDKVYSHYALYHKTFTSGLPYARWRRNPAHLAKTQPIVPGFSIYLCDQGGCPLLYGDLKSAIGGGAWAVTETAPELAAALIDGFPQEGITKPRFVVAYNFSSVELASPSALDHLKRALWGSAAPPTGQGAYVGVFSADGSYYYSNGSVYCRHKDAATMTCVTGQSTATVPEKPGLLITLQNGGMCQYSAQGSNYVGVFTAGGSYYYSNGSVRCRIKDAATMTCMTGQPPASVPDKPCQLIKLKDGGMCQSTATCSNT